ncbi:MAG: hypothetical protein Q8P59_12205, partial [Dehalococcoidia bacterium]|nr:hypothetical protein [Dehalococcoidia bacterium]
MRVAEVRRSGTEQQWVIPVGSVLIGAAAIALWVLLAASPAGFVIGSPLSSVQILISGLVGPNPIILPHAISTFSAAFIGFGLAIAVGVTWGVVLGVSW